MQRRPQVVSGQFFPAAELPVLVRDLTHFVVQVCAEPDAALHRALPHNMPCPFRARIFAGG